MTWIPVKSLSWIQIERSQRISLRNGVVSDFLTRKYLPAKHVNDAGYYILSFNNFRIFSSLA